MKTCLLIFQDALIEKCPSHDEGFDAGCLAALSRILAMVAIGNRQCLRPASPGRFSWSSGLQKIGFESTDGSVDLHRDQGDSETNESNDKNPASAPCTPRPLGIPLGRDFCVMRRESGRETRTSPGWTIQKGSSRADQLYLDFFGGHDAKTLFEDCFRNRFTEMTASIEDPLCKLHMFILF